ncbi:MAG: 3-isopropylmalate dehydratase large subunit [Clostridia bacterium]|nr:3-isopropylmalate dehydratase large subunit [Clostridia bacterium]
MMTMSQKILAHKSGLDKVEAGQLISAKPDVILSNDITGPVAVNEFNKAGCTMRDASKVVMVMDHFAPNKDIKSAENCKDCRTFCALHGIENFYDVGRMGIEHALLPEKGLVGAGDLVIGADSHTCTYGALGAFSTGVGSTDVAAAMASGELWFKVPSAIKVVLTGKPQKFVCGKDVILHLIGLIGVDGALYKSLEFTGDGVKHISVDDRFTICNMAIEAGAKNGIFPVDDVALEYMKGRFVREPEIFEADEDAEYDDAVEINLSELKPTVAFPHLPENTKTKWEEVKIDQVVIGSCTNGHISDLRAAASLMKGRKVADGVRVIVIPATQQIYLDALREGLIETFINAGAVVSTPTCGPCLGGYMGVLADGEKAVSTTNRNFVGRMGHTGSEIYLASPYVAAASALTGYLTSPEDL